MANNKVDKGKDSNNYEDDFNEKYSIIIPKEKRGIFVQCYFRFQNTKKIIIFCKQIAKFL